MRNAIIFTVVSVGACLIGLLGVLNAIADFVMSHSHLKVLP